MESTPHLVLFSRIGGQTTQHGLHGGSWHFRLESIGGEVRLEASDIEFDASQERLELLSVVRGLEAIDQPSSVTLVTSSRQVSRAVRQGLEYWRIRDWKWERFGEKVPMNHADLWKRIDTALQIHNVRCRTLRFDFEHCTQAEMASDSHDYRADNLADGLADRQPSRSTVVPKPKYATIGKRSSNVPKTRMVFRPLIWSVRKTADMLQSTSNALQRFVPDTHASPHLT